MRTHSPIAPLVFLLSCSCVTFDADPYEKVGAGGVPGADDPDAQTDGIGGDVNPSPEPVPDSDAEPEPEPCPQSCNGGCAQGVCIIKCTGKSCDKELQVCPANHDCRVECEGESCHETSVSCAQNSCSVLCMGKDSCEKLELVCQSARCEMNCSGDQACKDATFNCSAGASCQSVLGCDAHAPSVSCDNSECDEAECDE